MKRVDAIQRDLVHLVEAALDTASTPDELLDCAKAAVGVGDLRLMSLVAERVGAEVAEAADGTGAWRTEATWSKSKIDAWHATGYKARVLAEAWGLVGDAIS